MRMAGLLAAAVGATLAMLAAPSAQAADECRGLLVCIPVAGPWVSSRRSGSDVATPGGRGG